MIEVTGSIECDGATVLSDEWVPFKVQWDFPIVGQILYLRVAGADGGSAVVKIDSASGAVFQIVLNHEPPSLEDPPLGGHADRLTDEAFTIDPFLWKWKVTPDYQEPDQTMIRREESLRFFRSPELAVLAFSNESPARFLTCGAVRVGVSAQDHLVSVMHDI